MTFQFVSRVEALDNENKNLVDLICTKEEKKTKHSHANWKSMCVIYGQVIFCLQNMTTNLLEKIPFLLSMHFQILYQNFV